MAKRNTSARETLKTFANKVTSIRERDENKTRVAQSERDAVRDALGRLLAGSDDPDMDKRIRRQLRRLGHYISKKGKPWANAKKTRKTNANANATQPAEAEVVTNANATE